MKCFGNGKIGTNGSQRQAQTQNKMAECGKSFRVAIAKNYGQCDRTQVKTKRINKPGSSNKEKTI